MNETTTVLDVSRLAVQTSLQNLWIQIVAFVPLLVGALVVFIVGWIIAVVVGSIVERVLKTAKVNDAFDRIAGLRAAMHHAGMELNVAGFIGGLIKWLILIVTLLAASDILRLSGVSLFLNSVLQYIPNIVVASLIVVIGVIVGNFSQRVVLASIATARIPHGVKAALVAKWAVYGFAFLAALDQLQIGQIIIQPLVIGFFAMLAIAGGIAFGLGGQSHARAFLDSVEKDLTETPRKS